EGGLAAARGRGAALEGDEMAIFQPVMTYARHLVLLVEIDRQNLALENGGIEEGDLLLGRRDVIPAVIAERGGGGGIAQPLLHRGLGVGAALDRGFRGGIGQIAALADHGRAGDQEGGAGQQDRGSNGKLHGSTLIRPWQDTMCYLLNDPAATPVARPGTF